MILCFVFAAVQPRRSLHSFRGRTPIPSSLTPKSHGIISFADPHPLTLIESYRFKKDYPARMRVPSDNRESWDLGLARKPFTCNTYGAPRKCCKQRTYGLAKPFRINTYKKHGGSPFQATCCSLSSLFSPNSLPHNLFADPHPLNLYTAIFYKNSGGTGYSSSSNFFPCHTFETTRRDLPICRIHYLSGRRASDVLLETGIRFAKLILGHSSVVSEFVGGGCDG